MECEALGCSREVYVKSLGLCFRHYQILRRSPIRCYCEVPNCQTIPSKGQTICSVHREQMRHTQPIGAPTGRRNGRWRGGSSKYPDHGIFRRNGQIVMDRAGYKCQLCGSKAQLVHHRDGTKSNHDIDNLVALCQSCHMQGHFHPDRFGQFFEGIRKVVRHPLDKRQKL
jgi:5-methylcytosine-specific restriction endonuclease McrA